MRSLPRALLACVVLCAGAHAQGVRVLVQSSPLAGYRYHDAAQAWPEMRVGDRLELVREPGNVHDASAVRVEWRGRMLGYVPRRQNDAVAWGLDSGHALRARISALDAAKPASRRVEFEVYFE
jgi:hypothetical protein